MFNPRDALLSREHEIIRFITLINKFNLPCLIVGGYAVATIMKRFSVDLDLTIKEKDKADFEKLLKEQGYALSQSKEIQTIYGEHFLRFEKKIEGLPVSIDLLINGLVSRTTGASWSFDYIQEYSETRSLDSLSFLTPTKELLIAMKLHSGRISDTRDIVVVSENTSIQTILAHAKRGNTLKLKEIAKNALNFLKSKNFRDSFQGVFGVHAYRKDLIDQSEKIFEAVISMT